MSMKLRETKLGLILKKDLNDAFNSYKSSCRQKKHKQENIVTNIKPRERVDVKIRKNKVVTDVKEMCDEMYDVHYHPDIYETEDILDMIDYEKLGLDKVMMMSIIDNLELNISSSLKNGEICILPFIGRVKINRKAADLPRVFFNATELKKEFTKDEFSFIREALRSHNLKVNKEFDIDKAVQSRIRVKYKEEIEEMNLLYGQNYVDLFLKTMSKFTPVEFDQESQREFDLANGLINEDGEYIF